MIGLKLCVYAIAKNESKFANRFMDNMNEYVDGVYILDTGSTDNTVELFKNRGAIVHKRNYKKFRFNKARTDALSFVPFDTDICVCLDIDDVVSDNFFEDVKKKWIMGITKQMTYEYIYSADEDGNPVVSYYNNRIHSRRGFRWDYPIHEAIKFVGKDFSCIKNDDIKLYHKPDRTKSRAFYSDLIKERVKNHPKDFRYNVFLARDYINKKKYQECIEQCEKYFEIENNNRDWEKSKMYYYMAKCYRNLKDDKNTLKYAKLGTEVYDKNRDPFVELMKIYYKQRRFKETIEVGERALSIKDKLDAVVNDAESFNGTIEEILASCYYYVGRNEDALRCIDACLEMHPDSKKFLENKEFLLDAINN